MKKRTAFLLTFALILGTISCASSSSTQKARLKQTTYRQELAQEKAAADIVENDAVAKKIPEMTAVGYERAGDNYIRQGNMDMAFLQYGKALELAPEANGLRYKIGCLLLRRGLNEDALKTFEEMRKKEPDNAYAYEGIARVYIVRKDYEKAKINLGKALQLKPEFWQCHALFAFIYDRQGRYSEAIASYGKAIALKPDSVLLYNNLGMSYYMKGDYEKSSEAYIRALKINDKLPATFNNLGMAYGKMERYNDALNIFRRASDEASAYNNLGVVYMANGKYAEALNSFEKALELKPGFYVKAHENIGKARAAIRNTATAAKSASQ
jgi:tetratricopeptide (TPR) repeat protein